MHSSLSFQPISPLPPVTSIRDTGRPRCLGIATLVFFFCTALALRQASAQIYHVEEMNTAQIQNLDRLHTAVILVGGILEEHGPYLPSYTDGYVNEFIAREVAIAIAARPGWKVLMFPPIPLGSSGANGISGKLHFPGTYDVRESTLRAVFVDIASDLGEQGFRWVFILHLHGAPQHRRALDQAENYFRATYGGHMVNLWEIWPSEMSEHLDALRSAQGLDPSGEDGFSIHAGGSETSRMLSVRPELVDPNYKQARALTGHNFRDLMRIGEAQGWPGYFGSPRLASKEFGDEWMRSVAKADAEYALKILDGFDERSLPKWTLVSGFFPGFLFGAGFLWFLFALTLLWLFLVTRSVFRFSRWYQAIRQQDRPIANVLFRQIVPLLLALLTAALTLRALPALDYPLSLVRLAPDVNQTFLLLASVTLLLGVAKLATIAVVFVRANKTPK